jgi:hypothetical protein
MTLIPLNLPPGVYANGTESQARGRYRDCNLVRWFEGTLRPMGGWVRHSAGALTGAGRAINAWVDNDAGRWAGIGSHSGLYAMDRTGVLFDITPAGFTAGTARAVVGGGYGGSDFGEGAFGAPGADPGLLTEATVWSLDTFGENLVGVSSADGLIYRWDRNTGTPAVALTGGAPTNNRALVVTEEGFLFALGAGGNPRLVQWADQQSDSDWTVDPTLQAGNFPLQTTGRLMAGKRIRGGTLIFTDQDVHLATYQGAPLIYSFERVGSGCGLISQGAAVVGGNAVVAWMGKSGFWTYDGYAQPLPCEVADRVFGDLNRSQVSLITSWYSPSYGEMTWHYPSVGSSENNRYVRWNHRENHWAIGALPRLACVQEGVFDYPLAVGADGHIYAHESGFDYGGAEPFVETGPIELDNGDRVFTALALIPDEQILGDVAATFYGRMQPNESELVHGPYSPTVKTDVRFTARLARMRLTGARAADWRVGAFKLDLIMGGLR